MLKLIRLELRRNNIHSYVVASLLICIIMVAFIYFVAYVAQVENGARERQFQNYHNIFYFTETIGIVVFSIMSAVMYSRFIIGEYTGKRVALLFSYPVKRDKILLSKLLLVFSFSSLSMLCCISIPCIVFGITESMSPIVVQDVMTKALVFDTIKVFCVAVLAVGGVGIISMRVGFIKKSIPATLITAFILSAVYGSVAISINGTKLGLLIGAIGIIITIAVMAELSYKVNRMEVD